VILEVRRIEVARLVADDVMRLIKRLTASVVNGVPRSVSKI
jgi:hypothetical protein